jgi:hypothetical protein
MFDSGYANDCVSYQSLDNLKQFSGSAHVDLKQK